MSLSDAVKGPYGKMIKRGTNFGFENGVYVFNDLLEFLKILKFWILRNWNFEKIELFDVFEILYFYEKSILGIANMFFK